MHIIGILKFVGIIVWFLSGLCVFILILMKDKKNSRKENYNGIYWFREYKLFELIATSLVLTIFGAISWIFGIIILIDFRKK